MIISSSASSEKSDLVSPLQEPIYVSPIITGSRLVVDSNNNPPAVPIEPTVEPPKVEHQDQDEGLFTPTIRQSLDDFERKFARYWTRKVLELFKVPSGISRFVETPFTLAFILSTAYLVTAASTYSVKKLITLGTIIAYHLTKHSIAYAFRLSWISFVTFITFIILSTIFIFIKVFLYLPFHTLKYLVDLTNVSSIDATRTALGTRLTELRRHVDRNGLTVDVDEIKDRLDAQREVLEAKIEGWRRQVSLDDVEEWKKWSLDVMWKLLHLSSDLLILSLKWTGRSLRVLYSAAVWSLQLYRAWFTSVRSRPFEHLHVE